MTITYSQLGKMGRNGNQMFQIATTIATAFSNNTDFQFPLWEYETYFSLHGCFSSNLRKPAYTYQEPHFHYAEPPKNKDMDMAGYFQSYKYFEHCDHYIRQVFEFVDPIPPKLDTTAIHIRRTD